MTKSQIGNNIINQLKLHLPGLETEYLIGRYSFDIKLGKKLIENKDQLLEEFIDNKIKKYNNIIEKLGDKDSEVIISKRNLANEKIAKLKKCANVPLEIDRETNDYYYEVDINELTGKEFDEKLITNYAWELTLDGEKMRLILE